MDISKRTTRFIGLALSESAKSTYDRVKIGAVIADKNYPVSQAANLSTSHPLQYKYNEAVNRKAPQHNLHAEIHALIKSRDYDSLKGCTMYVARLDRRGNLAMCKPCKACAEALKDYGISNVVYTTPQGIRKMTINPKVNRCN